MADVQKQFEQFHDAIKLKEYGENATLREKRDVIRTRLKERLPKVLEEHGEVSLSFYFKDQGSYEMRTGIQPLDGDYDIDQGMYFAISTDAYPDPVVLKERVLEALEGHTQDVRVRQSCVTVFYQLDGEAVFHVDLALYSEGDQNADGKARLAKGRQSCPLEDRTWEVSDPESLFEAIFRRVNGTSRDQLRRIIRYLKRWKDRRFSATGHSAPRGIALTVAASDEFQASFRDVFAGKPDDLTALRRLTRAILARFTDIWDDATQSFAHRLVVKLPQEPWNDLFERMSNPQMKVFEDRLDKLARVLDEAGDEVDPVDACKKLRGEFGDDFPVPEPDETGKRSAPAFISSSNSA